MIGAGRQGARSLTGRRSRSQAATRHEPRPSFASDLRSTWAALRAAVELELQPLVDEVVDLLAVAQVEQRPRLRDVDGGAHLARHVEALAGVSGLYRVPPSSEPELVVAGPGLVGVAFSPEGGIVVASNDTAYRLLK